MAQNVWRQHAAAFTARKIALLDLKYQPALKTVERRQSFIRNDGAPFPPSAGRGLEAVQIVLSRTDGSPREKAFRRPAIVLPPPYAPRSQHTLAYNAARVDS